MIRYILYILYILFDIPGSLMLTQTNEICFPCFLRSALPVFPNQSIFICPHLTWEVLPGFCSDVTDAMITLITMIMTTKLI